MIWDVNMKLKSLHEGHWQIIGDHPGYPQKKKRKRRDLSFFVEPPELDVEEMDEKEDDK